MSHPASSISLHLEAFRMLSHPKVRWYVVIPILLNIALFFGTTLFVVHQLQDFFNWVLSFLPGWLDWLLWLFWLLTALLMLIIYAYTFTLVGNVVGSPFYGLLAERVREIETGVIDTTPFTAKIMWEIALRSLKREIIKFFYFAPRLIIILLLSFIPVVGPVLAGLWAAWSLALNFLDYPSDNDKIDFAGMKVQMSKKRFASLTFGGVALGLGSVPLLNIVAMPASIAAATLLWERQLKAA